MEILHNWQVVCISKVWYATEVSSLSSDDKIERINSFTETGDMVLLCDDLSEIFFTYEIVELM